ncbi:MAG TPA: radical SAM protein [Nitrospirota bacterium]
MIIPFFIPHSGCPHQCVFCNQKNITGQDAPADSAAIKGKINEYLKTRKKGAAVSVAFYGGSFTALPLPVQRDYLQQVQPFIQAGEVESIRLSTRPDCITGETLALLKNHRVGTVELGVQSMDDRVLALSGRGHTAAHTVTAVNLLRESGFPVGLQLMAGLPGDSPDRFRNTVEKIIGLKPAFVRLYPVLVLKGTPLERLYRIGAYAPLPLEEAVTLCREALIRFEQAGIGVIRIGLQPTAELNKPGTIAAGPYHPAFRQLVESSILLDAMRSLLLNQKRESDEVIFQVNRRDLSAAAGVRRSNIDVLQKEFGLKKIRIVEGSSVLKKWKPVILPSS